MISTPGNGSPQTPLQPEASTATAPLAEALPASPLPLMPSMFVGATDGGVFSNWFIPLWMLPPMTGDGLLDARALQQILKRTQMLVQTQMETVPQVPLPGPLPISALIMPSATMLAESMFAQQMAVGAPIRLPLHTEPVFGVPGTDAAPRSAEKRNGRLPFRDAFKLLLDGSCQSALFILRKISIAPPSDDELNALVEAMAGNRHTNALALTEVACPGLLDMLGKALSGNESVRRLHLRGSCSAGSGAALARLITAGCHLQFLDISNCKLTADDWRTLSNTLQPGSMPPSVRAASSLPNDSGAALATLLRASVFLRALDISCCEALDAADWRAILDALENHSTLEELNVSGCTLEGVGLQLQSFFISNRSLKRLDISDDNLWLNRPLMSVEDWFAIAEGLSSNNTLQSMHASGACKRGTGAALANILINNRSLKQLDISDCTLLTIGDWLAIWAALKDNHTLEELNARGGAMGGAGSLLAQALVANDSLRRLDLAYSTMTADDLLAIGKVLPGNRTLEILKLGHANSPEKQSAIKMLLTGLLANQSLKALGLPDVQSAEIIGALTEVLRIHPALCELDLGIITDEESMLAALSEAMTSAARLTCIRFSLNAFRSADDDDATSEDDGEPGKGRRTAGVATLFDALGQCTSLERVEIDDAFFHLDALLAFLRKHPRIREVEARGRWTDAGAATHMTAILAFVKSSSQLIHCRISTAGLAETTELGKLTQLESDIAQAAATNRANHQQRPVAARGMAAMLGRQAGKPDARPELPLDITQTLAAAIVRHAHPDDAKRIFDTVSPYAPPKKN